MFGKMSLRDRLICFADFFWNDSACSPFLATTTQLFSQSLSSHTLCNCLEFLSATNNLCNFWHGKFQQINSYAFCSWDDFFTQNWNCSSPNNLCKCTESPSTLSTNTSIEWNLYLSWSNHPLTYFELEMNVGGFSEHQNKTSDTNRYKSYFFSARVSQVNVNAMKKFFELWSELQVAKCLIVHLLSSNYNVSSLEFRSKKKVTQQWCFRVANDILLNQVRVYHERLYADNVVGKFWLVRSFSSKLYSNFIANNTSQNVSKIRTKECETRSFICNVNLNSFCSSRHFNCATNFAVIVSFLN